MTRRFLILVFRMILVCLRRFDVGVTDLTIITAARVTIAATPTLMAWGRCEWLILLRPTVVARTLVYGPDALVA